MKRSRFNEEEVIGILREGESGSSVKAVCAKHNISEATYYAWKRKFGGMDVSEARRLRGLEEENARLKRLVADQAVQIQILKEVNSKKMVSPSTKRRAIKLSVERGLGRAASACPGSGTGAIEFLSQRLGESGKAPSAQRGRKAQRQASAVWLPAHYRFAAAGGL